MKQFFLYPWRSFGNDFESRPQGNIEFDEQQSLVGPTVKKSIIPIISRKKDCEVLTAFASRHRQQRGREEGDGTTIKLSKNILVTLLTPHMHVTYSQHQVIIALPGQLGIVRGRRRDV